MMMDTSRIVVSPGHCFRVVTRMIVTLILVLLQQLCLPVLPTNASQEHSSRFDGSAPTVTIPQGTFTGTRVNSSVNSQQIAIEEFRGIPYAQPPTGTRRYSPALEVGPSSATFDASKYGPVCIQNITVANEDEDEDEDCLKLNVFRRSGTSSGQKLPVVVYIHGGAFTGGSGASRDIGGMVAASSAPIMGVSMNYRLAALGFLSSGLIARAGALNLGLRDQQFALKWIQANIDEFGGDPTKITIMGDSAGGHSVGHHIQDPLAAGLFHQAIMESGAATARICQPYNSSLNAQQFQDFMSAVGIDLAQPDDAVLAALRALPVTTIKQASSDVVDAYFFSDRFAFQPVIDGPGGVIPSAPLDLWESCCWNKVPILTGFCDDEGAPWVQQSISTSKQFTDFFTVLNPLWSTQDINTINNLYPDPLTDPNSPYPSEYRRITAAYGQFAYIAPIRHTAHFAGASGLQVYLYDFKVNISASEGTSHSCAGPYVTYDAAIVNFSPTQKRIAKAVNTFWTNFVANGDPNVGASNDVAWPRYVEASNSANKVVFGAGNDERAGGKNAGVAVETAVDTEFLTQTHFWWSETLKSES